VIAKLVPIRPKPEAPYLPDFAARRRKIFGRKKMSVTGAEIMAWDRGQE
jgi:hypothetical protein